MKMSLIDCNVYCALPCVDVLQLLSSCPCLSELDLSDAALLTSLVMEHLEEKCVPLRYLALSRCYGINFSSLASVENSCFISTLSSLATVC